MNRYTIEIKLNRRDDGMNYLNGHRPGDPLETIGTYTFDAATHTDAAEAAFEFGNLHHTTDEFGNTWPTGERSMSKGDVLVISDGKGRALTLACASVGWKHLD